MREELENLIEVKSEYKDIAEIVFLQINCGQITTPMGLVYAPQEPQTTVQELDTMYRTIEEEIDAANLQNHLIILAGDFNCKIGEVIPGNKKEISKSGRRLLDMARKNNLKIMNTSQKCQGMWTRIQAEKKGIKKSVIDYILVSEAHENLVKNMKIDEEKAMTPFRDDSTPGKPIYTDHNMITVNMNFQIEKRTERMKIDRKKMWKFAEATENSKLTEMLGNKKEDLKDIYKKWNDETIKIMKETCGQKKTKIENERLVTTTAKIRWKDELIVFRLDCNIQMRQ